MRLDVVLFELRLYKSRSQAAAAVEAGRALLNGQRAKPSRAVRAGDRVTILEPRPRMFEILELPRRSLSREAAKQRLREVAED